MKEKKLRTVAFFTTMPGSIPSYVLVNAQLITIKVKARRAGAMLSVCSKIVRPYLVLSACPKDFRLSIHFPQPQKINLSQHSKEKSLL